MALPDNSFSTAVTRGSPQRLHGGVQIKPVPAFILHLGKQDRLAFQRRRAEIQLPSGQPCRRLPNGRAGTSGGPACGDRRPASSRAARSSDRRRFWPEGGELCGILGRAGLFRGLFAVFAEIQIGGVHGLRSYGAARARIRQPDTL